jgi:nucleoside-diphosphate-sugar epimerase
MKALFIGGTGNISSAVSRLAIQAGWDLTLLTRGQSQRHPAPDGARIVQADITKPDTVRAALGGQRFDVVANWIAFKPEDIARDLALFQGCGQYIFVSSASAYQKPASSPFITESTPLANPYWDYSRAKIACEEALNQAHRATGAPITIVRPSHTYDTVIPVALANWNYSVVARLAEGKPWIIHGDGTSLWTVTHSEDFAKGFVGLMGNTQAIGHAFHITTDEVLTWNQIYQTICDVFQVRPNFVHIPTEFICRFDAGYTTGTLWGDKAHAVVFDNSKLKRFVPGYQATISFRKGLERTRAWFDADPKRRELCGWSKDQLALMDRIIAAYGHGFRAIAATA